MSISLFFKLTQPGLAACWNAKNTGTTIEITHVQVGSGNRAPDGTEVELLDPREVVAIAAGSRVSPGQVRMTAMFQGNALAYDIAELGLWKGAPGAAGSVLVCYWSQATGVLTSKAAGVDFVFSHDMAISDATAAGVITVLADTSLAPALALLTEHEAKADPHPGYMRKFKLTDALPQADVGPIWHDAYNSVMTWQTFNANGATYTGYASVDVGCLSLDTQPTARRGYIKSGVTNLSRTAYASLRNWAIHNGVLVASAAWAAGAFVFKDNADGTTFAVADVRGEFPRFWDDGRGVDGGRAFGSAQFATPVRVKQAYTFNMLYGVFQPSSAYYDTFTNTGGNLSQNLLGTLGTAPGNSYEGNPDSYGFVRPRNTALLAAIKY